MSSSRVGWRVRVRSYLANAPRGSFVAMLRLVREDYWAYNGDWSRPGLRALAAHRLGHWLLGAPPAARLLLGWYYRRLFVKARNVYGIEIPAEAVIGRRVHFAHQHGTSVHYQSVIGDDCLIRQNVTLGAVSNERIAGGPVLGDRVQLSPGVVIVGRVTIGADARVGPNCVVMTNIPAGATVVASPPRVLRVARRPESAGGRAVTLPPDFVAPAAVAVPAPPPAAGPTPAPLPPDHDAAHALR